MDAGEQDRDQEYRKHLRIDAAFDIVSGHSDFLHDIKPCLVFKSFGNLLVVNDDHAGYQEDDAQQDPQKEQTAEGTDEIPALRLMAFAIVIIKVHAFQLFIQGFAEGFRQCDLSLCVSPVSNPQFQNQASIGLPS